MPPVVPYITDKRKEKISTNDLTLNLVETHNRLMKCKFDDESTQTFTEGLLFMSEENFYIAKNACLVHMARQIKSNIP